jgi:hypothetical protein
LSRAFMRSLRGDLRHDPSVPGCCFVLELMIASHPENGGGRMEHNVANPATVG